MIKLKVTIRYKPGEESEFVLSTYSLDASALSGPTAVNVFADQAGLASGALTYLDLKAPENTPA